VAATAAVVLTVATAAVLTTAAGCGAFADKAGPSAGTPAASLAATTASQAVAATSAAVDTAPASTAATAATGAATASASGDAPPASSSAGPARTRYPIDAKVVALTFDDGPNPRWTPRILAVLKEYEVRGTFFILGQMINAHGGTAKKVRDAGMLLANHSEGHENMAKMTAAQVRRDLGDCQDNIERVTGVRPKYLRWPFGSSSVTSRRVAKEMGLTMVDWGLDSGDWEKPSVGSIVSRVTRNAKPGTIILMHDGGGDRSHTVEALPAIIRALKAKGYRFVTVDELAPRLLTK
jgi:peptidoglycan/xylan/chitin deacetylase (PgdA/CDA1 family)